MKESGTDIKHWILHCEEENKETKVKRVCYENEVESIKGEVLKRFILSISALVWALSVSNENYQHHDENLEVQR